MSVSFNQGQVLGRTDLDIFLTNASGNPANAYSISYAIYCVDPTSCVEVLIGSATRTPVNPAVGEYYAALQVPPEATVGDYRIRWTFQELATTPAQTVVQEFGVVGLSVPTTATTYSACVQGLITKLRFMLRDTNPDRDYHFRPPEGEGVVGCYNQVFGFIWTDEELYEFLEISLWKWNMHPPETEYLSSLDAICTQKPVWQAAILWGGIVNAAMALAINWIADEFSVEGGTLVRVVLPDGREIDVPIAELYGICHKDIGCIVAVNSETRESIREAFQLGNLQVRTADPTSGMVGIHDVTAVLEHNTPHKEMVRVTLIDGKSVITTVDHSLFYRDEHGITPVEAGILQVGDVVATVVDGVVAGLAVSAIDRLPPTPSGKTYDLSVPGPQNFVLSNGILAHNSYSIGGISLDIDKSSKYMDIKQNAEDQWDKLTEAKLMTTKYMAGLAQPRFGRGVRSAFGPAVDRGVLSPRGFIVFTFSAGGAMMVWEAIHSVCQMPLL